MRECILDRHCAFSQGWPHYTDADGKQKEVDHRTEKERDDRRARQIFFGILHIASNHTNALKTCEGVKEQNRCAAERFHRIGGRRWRHELIHINEENTYGNEKNQWNHFTNSDGILNDLKGLHTAQVKDR